MAFLKDRFKDGDIVWAEWETVKLKRNVGVVVGIHPPPYMHDPTSITESVLVKIPGYLSERAFAPDIECRPATAEEQKRYFRDVLKHGQ